MENKIISTLLELIDSQNKRLIRLEKLAVNMCMYWNDEDKKKLLKILNDN